MTIDEVKIPKIRIPVADVTNLDIQSYGNGNNYPQMILQLLGASSNAKVVLAGMQNLLEVQVSKIPYFTSLLSI